MVTETESLSDVGTGTGTGTTEAPQIEFTDSFLPTSPIDLTALAAEAAEPSDGGEEECGSHMPPTSLLTSEWFPHNDSAYRDHYGEAIDLLEEGRQEEAVEALRMEIFDAPDSATTWLLLGETYAALSRKEKALDAAHEALSYEPEFADAWAFLARLYLREGQSAAAKQAAEQLVSQRPHDAEASHLLARSQMGLAMWSEAINTCKRTIEIDPEFTRAYNNLGFSALQIGENSLAKEYLVELVELPGVEAYMLNNLGIAYERNGEHGDAVRSFSKALELNPNYSRAALNRERAQKRADEEVAAALAKILSERNSEIDSSTMEAASSVAAPTQPGTHTMDSDSATP